MRSTENRAGTFEENEERQMDGILCIAERGGDVWRSIDSLRGRMPGLVFVEPDEFSAASYSSFPPAAIVVELGDDDCRDRHRLDEIEQACPESARITVGRLAPVRSGVGARDLRLRHHLGKPVDPTLLEALLRAQLSRIAESNGRVRELVGASVTIRDLEAQIQRIAWSDVPVLITGETGTGKELAARAIHAGGPRRNGPFVTVNCAALPDGLLESELFGHERGAFTGAAGRRVGRFELAHRGTIFLDEIGDSSPLFQARLLRVLQERTIQRVGGETDIPVSGRVVAATHRDLGERCAVGAFRQDLRFRLDVVRLHMPALRERVSDIPLLIEHFLHRFRAELGRGDVTLSEAAMTAACRHDWPGNVRELEHRLKSAVLMSEASVLTAEHLRLIGSRAPAAESGPTFDENSSLMSIVRECLRTHHGDVHSRFVAFVERALFAEALRATGNNVSRLATLLGLSRPTLRGRLVRLGLRAPEMQGDDRSDDAH